MKLSNLAVQIFSTSFLIALFSLIIVSWYASEIGQDFYLQKTEESLLHEARLISRILDDSLLTKPSVKLQKTIDHIAGDIALRITIIRPDGRVISDSEQDYNLMDNHISRPEILQARENGIGKSVRFSHTVKRNLMYVAIYEDSGQRRIYIRTAKTLSVIEEAISSLQKRIFSARGNPAA